MRVVLVAAGVTVMAVWTFINAMRAEDVRSPMCSLSRMQTGGAEFVRCTARYSAWCVWSAYLAGADSL